MQKLLTKEIGVGIGLGLLTGIAFKMSHWSDIRRLRQWYVDERKQKTASQ